jgi:hypothetical protein
MRNEAGERINSGKSGVRHGDLSPGQLRAAKARPTSCDMHAMSAFYLVLGFFLGVLLSSLTISLLG